MGLQLNRRTILFIIFLIQTSLFLGACTIPVRLSNTQPSFSLNDLLISLDEMPLVWKVKSGPERVGDNTRSSDSLKISFSPLDENEKYLVLQMVFRYKFFWGAKADYSDQIRFPENTVIDEWTFQSTNADESRFSCYTYSNDPTPVCRWVARYENIIVDLIVRLEPDGLSIQEMENLVVTIDSKVNSLMNLENEE